MNFAEGALTLPVIFSAIGAVAGLLIQQAIDVWKTRTAHRHELQRRFFDVKLQTAIDVAKSLDAFVSSHQARLTEAAEWAREEERFESREKRSRVRPLLLVADGICLDSCGHRKAQAWPVSSRRVVECHRWSYRSTVATIHGPWFT